LIKSNASILVGTSSWREQFADAIKVNADDDDESQNSEDNKGGAAQEDKEEKQPTCGDYLIHFISLFWKLLFAFVPPTGNLNYFFLISLNSIINLFIY
jgi:solute carrier family 8 (sodium/calcium exchanger)